MPVKVGKFIYWTPRILSILFILFLAMFSLDVIEPGRSVGDIIIGLIMHNIPVFILTGLLVIAWKHEAVGAVTFISAGVLYSGLTVEKSRTVQNVNTQNLQLMRPSLWRPDDTWPAAGRRGWQYRFAGGYSRS